MGCDAYANKDGVFEIEIRDYKNVDGVRFEPKTIRVEGLSSWHRIAIEIMEGDERG